MIPVIVKQNESALEAMSRSNQSMVDRLRTQIITAMQATTQQRTAAASGTANANQTPSPDAVASAVTKALEKTLQSRLLDGTFVLNFVQYLIGYTVLQFT